MKFLSRVIWSEGMYLAPHHFQTQSRYFEDSVRFAIEHAWFEPWGSVHYRLDKDAIENGRVALLSAQGIFEDGLAFAMPDCDPLPPERDIREILSPLAESLLVSLVVQKRQPALPSCDLNGGSGSTRYRAVSHLISDMNDGLDQKEVKLCQKNVRLLSETEIDDGMWSIPIARVRRDRSGHFVYDPDFIPPCTRLTASERLMAFLGQMVEVLEEKRKSLQQPRQSGKFRAGVSQAEVSNFWFLHTVNDALAWLRHFYLSKRGHPEELFTGLSRLAGALCTFSFDSDPAGLPLYDHRHLDGCFQALASHILDHLEIVVHGNTIEVPLQRSGPNLFVGEIGDRRCFGRTRWVLGVGSSAGEAKVLTQGASIIKMCSQKFVGELVKRAMPGLELIHLSAAPAAIPGKPDLQYFSVNKAGPCWNHMMESGRVGVYVPNDLPEATVELHVILGG
jgi:type VI secretion system protein ImpJ